MDFHLKQWRDQQHQDESDEQQQASPAKFPRLVLQTPEQPPSDHQSALPLFVPEQTQSHTKINTYPDSKPPLPPSSLPSSRLSNRLGGNFSIAQWQELELQALIFRHMVAGASVPPELLQLVKKSLLNSPSYYSYYQPSLLQAGGYWGRAAMDPEPGRCRRTDGKKWRCSREVVPGQKYCERHVHRGRNRSRKPVEFAATTTTTTNTTNKPSAFASSHQGVLGGGAQFSLSGPTPSLDIFQLNQGASEAKTDRKFLFDTQNDTSGVGKSNDRVLRHFFDDWPRTANTGEGGVSPVNSTTCLSISSPGGNQSLDFLKLSTGNGGDEVGRRVDSGRDRSEWSGGNQVAAMGGPLAEALRSSTGSSPTSVLHQLPRSTSGASYVSA